MTSDLSSTLEVCFKRDALNKSMFTLLYFTNAMFMTGDLVSLLTVIQSDEDGEAS